VRAERTEGIALDRAAKDELHAQFARVGRALANPHRVELLDLLAQGERSVEVLAARATITVGLASAHLQTLRSAGLVAARRDGTRIVYRLSGDDVYELLGVVRSVATRRIADADLAARVYLGEPVEAVSRVELLARVRANLRRVRERAMLQSDETIEIGDLTIEPSQLRAEVGGEPVRLRLKEFQLLLALAKEPGKLMTRQRLAREVWGYDHLASSRTIDVHIRRLRQAVEDVSDYVYVHTVHGVGYRFEARPKVEA